MVAEVKGLSQGNRDYFLDGPEKGRISRTRA
jgi:hypothetical protein